MPARLMATTDPSILSTESLSALARGITGGIQPGSGIAAVTGTVTVGLDGVILTIVADSPTTLAGMPMGAATPAPTADSVVDKPSTGARCMAAASMAEAASTAEDADSVRFADQNENGWQPASHSCLLSRCAALYHC